MLSTKRQPVALAVALSLGVVSMAAAAEEAAAESSAEKVMPSIEVIRVKGDQQLHRFDETGSVILIDRAQIEQVQPLSTEDVLRRVPGINIKGEEETSIVANFGIRGLSASESKSLLLEDGVPVAPGLFIGNDRYFNTRIQRVESVEVLKGSASLRYGPSTIGGVVNYITKTPTDGVQLSARAGSFNLREMTLEAGAKNQAEDAFLGVVATKAKSDGFMDKGYDMSDVMVKAGLAISDKQKVGIKFAYHENEANISYRGIFLQQYLNGERNNPAPDDWYLTDRTAFDLNHEYVFDNNAKLNTLVYWSNTTRDYWRYDANTAASNAAGRWVYTDNIVGNNRSFERLGIESRLSFDQQLFGYAAATEFGLRLMEEEADDTRIRATRAADRSGNNDRHIIDSANSVAGYAQSRIQLTDDFAVTPGLRVESYEQKRTILTQNGDSAKTSNTELLPGVGATYELTANAQLYGGVYRAFSPASNGVALDGLTDQQLDGERSVNYELGLRGTMGAANYEVSAFYMDFANQVVTGNSDPNLSQSNAGKTEHTGMEFLFGYNLGAGFRLDTNATWVPTSEFKTGVNAGNRLPYAPKVLANVALSYSADAFSVALTAHHRGEQFGDPSNRIDIPANAAGGIWGGLLPAYTVYDLLAQYTAFEGFTVYGSVKNLTDKQYVAGLRQGIYVGPERAFEAGFRYRF
ncbi:TonB-dependent receptor [Alishewanella sp. BS5-314]|uniref:TonB-dependent receptor family protein n=1 Tax=Alishewanella sp. BS5-314 TaxID=2755587 RepID=UPI0021BB2A77|nr:TonB-dependent receptor [Alishewanella sp. BS5-314]MCT8127368.1 TonB-dependent receptor [Alishewanella sp. BS5-314]